MSWPFSFYPLLIFFWVPVLDSLVDPLQKTINFKPKQDAVKQEVDRNEDMIRSALRAIAALNRIRFGLCFLIQIELHWNTLVESIRFQFCTMFLRWLESHGCTGCAVELMCLCIFKPSNTISAAFVIHLRLGLTSNTLSIG